MSTYKTLADVIKEIEYWLRLATFLHEPLKNSLLHVLHNTSNHPGYVGLPSDPNLLYQELHRHHISVINQLRKNKILSQEQYEKIFPPNQTETDSSNFDITLIVFLIRNCTSLPAPKGGWSITSLPSNDQGISANVVRAREWRNFLQHANPAEIDHVVFKKKWQEGVDIITSFGFVFDTQSLLQESLDPKNQKILNSLNYYLDLLRINVIDLQKDNKTTQQTLGAVLNEQEDLRNVVKTLQNELKAATSMKNNAEKNDPGDLVLPSVLVSVARLIGDDWAALAKEIGVESAEIEKLQANNSTKGENAKECFDLKNNRVTWKKLRTSLNKIQRVDISNTISKQSLITHALQEASMRLKNLYIEELVDWLIEQPFRINGTRVFDAVPREQAYVELAMLHAQELDHLWNNVDRDFHLQQQQFEKTSIQMDDILKHEDKFVIVRGIAGIGKSTMVDSFVLKWAKSQILNGGVNQKINFLFKMKCRDLNVTQDFQSVEELLKLKFPTIFRDISIADLDEISHQVLILLDGIDELKEISAFKEHSIDMSSLRTNVIRELLWSQSQHLSGHRSIVCGRPEACQYIASSFSPVVPLKTIEICGFNNKSVERFIDFFHRHECKQAHLVKEKIKESENLKVMASIPVYLWVICNIFKENVITSTINTTTELCAYSFLLFIRNHLKAIKKRDSIPLVNLCSDPDVLTITIALAKLSYKTLKESKVVFSEKEVSLMETSIKLEETGFITKHLYSDTEGFMYQFKHLVLQEFLSALWCYLNYDFNFGHVFPLISGLFSLENVKTDSILSHWLVNLRNKIMENKNLIGYLKNQLKRTKNFQKQLSDRTSELIQGKRIVISSSQSSLLSAIYEHQNKTFLSKDFQKNLSIIIKNLSFQHDIRNAIYFIGMLETKDIESISIQNINNNKLPDNVCTLCELFFTGNSDQKVIAIEGGDQMKISTEIFYEDRRVRRINLTLCKPPYYRSMAKRITYDETSRGKSLLDEFFMPVITYRDAPSIETASTEPSEIIQTSDTLVSPAGTTVTSATATKATCDTLSTATKSASDATSIATIATATKATSDTSATATKATSNTSSNVTTSDIFEVSTTSCVSSLTPCNTSVTPTTTSGSDRNTAEHTFFLHKTLLISLFHFANKIIINSSVERLYDVLMTLIYDGNHHLKLHVECGFSSFYHPELSVQDVKSMNDMQRKMIKEKWSKCTKHDFSYEYLDLSNSCVNDSFIEDMANFIVHHEYVSFRMSSSLSSMSMRILNDALKTCQQYHPCILESLDLTHCALTFQHVQEISKQLPMIETIILDQNEFNDDVLKCILAGIKLNGNKKMKYISFRHCKLQYSSVPLLIEMLKFVECLDASRNNLSPVYLDETTISAKELENIGPNKELVFSRCNLSDEDVCKLLPLIFKVTTVNLSENYHLTDISASAISSYFRQFEMNQNNYNLRNLNLSSCSFLSDKMYEALLPSLSYLDALDVRQNSIDLGQIQRASDFILQRSTPIEKLKFLCMTTTEEYLLNFTSCIKNNKSLYISCLSLSPEAMKHISANINNKKSFVTSLTFTKCYFDLESVKELLPSLVKIQNLSFSDIPLTAELIELIAQKLYPNKNNVLRSLRFRSCKLNDRSITLLIPCLPFIKDIGLKFNDFSDEKVRQIIQYIGDAIDRKESKLQFITLRINNLIVKLKGCKLKFEHQKEFSNDTIVAPLFYFN